MFCFGTIIINNVLMFCFDMKKSYLLNIFFIVTTATHGFLSRIHFKDSFQRIWYTSISRLLFHAVLKRITLWRFTAPLLSLNPLN